MIETVGWEWERSERTGRKSMLAENELYRKTRASECKGSRVD